MEFGKLFAVFFAVFAADGAHAPGGFVHFLDGNGRFAEKSLFGLNVGGNANSGADDGLATAYARNAPSYANANIGSRLCFVPA